MGLREKETLYRLIVISLMQNIHIPRGYPKNMNTILMNIHNEAVKRTKYCLAALDEDYEPELFRGNRINYKE